jgi:hypothetical protein
MKKLVFAVFFVIGIGVSGICGQTKNDDIVKMLRVSGSDKMSSQMFDNMMAQFKPLMPNANWAQIKKKANLDGLLYECVPVYDKYYTHDEIKELIKFYESPLGRKMVDTNPLILNETMAIGQRWGEKLTQIIMSELK